MSIAKAHTLPPSLAEIEEGMILFFSQEADFFKRLRQLPWLWNKVPFWGKIVAPLFSKKRFWKELFLAVPLVDSALHHMEKMNRGDFREHEEERLCFFQRFLQENPKLLALVEERATPALAAFLSKELPSFHKKKDFFRKKIPKERGREESCSWYRNESFLHYIRRMEERLYISIELEQKPTRHAPPLPKIAQGMGEAKAAWEMTDGMKRAFRRIKERVTLAISRSDDLKKQIRLVKHRSFLMRAEDCGLYNAVILLEENLLTLSIRLEELLSHIPEGKTSRYTQEEEARKALQQQEIELESIDRAVEDMKSETKRRGAELSLLKKRIETELQALGQRVLRLEAERLKEGFSDAHGRLIAQAKHALEEYRKGLFKAPGLLFSLEKLRAHMEELFSLCASFLWEEEVRAPFQEKE